MPTKTTNFLTNKEKAYLASESTTQSISYETMLLHMILYILQPNYKANWMNIHLQLLHQQPIHIPTTYNIYPYHTIDQIPR